MCNQCIASKKSPVLKRKQAVSAGGPSGSLVQVVKGTKVNSLIEPCMCYSS